MKKLIQATLILSGMIIGVGMFGIPFSFFHAGFWLGVFELCVLTGIVLFLHLIYGEIVLSTEGYHRMPGYVKMYLGSGPACVSWCSAFFGISGALLVYIVLGSIFLNKISSVLWSGSNEFFWATAIAVFGAFIIFFPEKKTLAFNGILTVALIGFIIFLVIFLLPHVELKNLSGFSLKNIFIPYGVLLFALSGGVVVPDMISFLGKNRSLARRAIFFGTLIPALLYLFFSVAVVGVSGPAVSEEGIRGLTPYVGEYAVLIGSFIGFLAAFTSFIALGASFEELMRLDFNLPRLYSWAGVSIVPFLLYLLKFQNFIVIMGIVGAVAVGIDSALLVASYHAMRKKQGVKIQWHSRIWKYALYVIISGGVLYQFFYLIP